ncbi:MAG: histidine kinase [Rhodocyclaceae bacterium]|nr:MAG: histidine kinase [Rhodocyclaceae bacterium]
MKRHPLLERQLRHAFGGSENVPAGLESLLAAVSAAYEQADRDRQLVEHSLEEMSVELTQRNREMRLELEERKNTEIALQREQQEQAALIKELEQAHAQLLQSEKLASIGQLAAGVAHEINNPVGYVQANVGALEDYLRDLFGFIDSCEAAIANLPAEHPAREPLEQAKRVRDIGFLRGDIPALLDECKEGLTRVRKIVQDLKDFSHPDEGSVAWSDLHQGLDSTLNIVHNELKYKAEVLREYGALPKIQCNLAQLNQVFMNLLVNASHAIDAKGTIRIRSGQDEPATVWVEISDTGCGIPEESFGRIFDPFYTTKPVGKGTGLGLSLSYAIVQRHHGRIDVRSKVGEGTTFRVTLPVVQPDAAAQ